MRTTQGGNMEPMKVLCVKKEPAFAGWITWYEILDKKGFVTVQTAYEPDAKVGETYEFTIK